MRFYFCTFKSSIFSASFWQQERHHQRSEGISPKQFWFHVWDYWSLSIKYNDEWYRLHSNLFHTLNHIVKILFKFVGNWEASYFFWCIISNIYEAALKLYLDFNNKDIHCTSVHYSIYQTNICGNIPVIILSIWR